MRTINWVLTTAIIFFSAFSSGSGFLKDKNGHEANWWFINCDGTISMKSKGKAVDQQNLESAFEQIFRLPGGVNAKDLYRDQEKLYALGNDGKIYVRRIDPKEENAPFVIDSESPSGPQVCPGSNSRTSAPKKAS